MKTLSRIRRRLFWIVFLGWIMAMVFLGAWLDKKFKLFHTQVGYEMDPVWIDRGWKTTETNK